MSTGIWIDTATAAKVLGITERVARLNAQQNKYGPIRHEADGPGRPGLRIQLDNLPERAQIAYHAIQAGAAGPEPTRAALAELSEQARHEIAERAMILDTWQAYCTAHAGGAGKAELTRRFAAEWTATHPEQPLTLSTLYRWNARRRADPALLARQYNRENTGPQIPPRARDAFLALYLDQARRSAELCYQIVIGRAKAEKWPELEEIPSKRTFDRLVESLAKAVVVYHRKGPKAYSDKCDPHIIRDYTTISPGDIWVADHHQLDLAVQGPNGKPLFPWSTVWMDVRSRRYIGWVLSFGPNTDTVLLSFRRGVIGYGLPAVIYVDNGKDFRALDFAGGRKKIRFDLDEARVKSLTALLGIQAAFAQPYNARSKPIERSFLTVKEWFSKLADSYRGGNTQERPERLAAILKKPDKLMTIEELELVYSEWVESVYNEHPHAGQGMNGRSPRQVYDELCVTKRTAPEEILRLALMRSSQPLAIGRNGININGRYYTSDALMMRQGQQVYVRYDPAEAGLVYVFDLQDRYICQADNRQMVSWGATSEDIRAAKSESKRKKNLVKQYREALDAEAAEPDVLKRVIERRKTARQAAPKTKPDPIVIHPIRPFGQASPITAARAESAAAAEEPIDIGAYLASRQAQESNIRDAERRRREKEDHEAMAILGGLYK